MVRAGGAAPRGLVERRLLEFSGPGRTSIVIPAGHPGLLIPGVPLSAENRSTELGGAPRISRRTRLAIAVFLERRHDDRLRFGLLREIVVVVCECAARRQRGGRGTTGGGTLGSGTLRVVGGRVRLLRVPRFGP